MPIRAAGDACEKGDRGHYRPVRSVADYTGASHGLNGDVVASPRLWDFGQGIRPYDGVADGTQARIAETNQRADVGGTGVSPG